MLASRLHRLHHTAWHTLRGVWRDPLNDADRAAIGQLNWAIARAPFDKNNVLDVGNGAGEDFLFMHRRMIAMVHDIYQNAGAPPPQGWKTLPGANTPQFVFVETDDPQAPGKKTYVYEPAASGVMVPPATPDYLDLFRDEERPTLRYLKTPEYFSAAMRPQDQLIRRRSYLADALPLGALGNIIEFTIHNQMHMRWTAPPRDPSTGAIAARSDFDFDPKWDDPRNDFLGDFYSSHVSPVFWRLHGWVDDRIEDWYQAQEAVRPGVVKRRVYKGVNWFEKGDWVAAEDPFDQPAWWDAHDHHHGGHAGDDQAKIDVMLKVMDIVKSASERRLTPTEALEARLRPQRRFTSFADRLFLAP